MQQRLRKSFTFSPSLLPPVRRWLALRLHCSQHASVHRRGRTFALATLLLALFVVVSCAPVPQPGGALPEGVVRGSVTFPDLRPLPANAVVEVQIIDPTVSGYPANVFASTTIQAGALRPPIPFQLVFDPARVREDVDYLIGAQVRSGDNLLYVSQSGQQVLGRDEPRDNLEVAASGLPAQAAVPGQLNGVLTWLTRDLLPDNAVVAVQLVDRTTQPYQRVSESSFRSGGTQTPIPFLIAYDPESIDPLRTYGLEARISVDGRLAWLTEQPVAVLTQNAPADNLEVPLQRVASETAATAGNNVVANLIFPAGDVLPIGSTVIVEITDLTQNAIVASAELHGEGLQSPLAVEIPLTFTPSELRQYVLRARISGPTEALYIDETELQVLTQGAPVTNIAVPLVALQAPVVFATSQATPIPVPTVLSIAGDVPAPALAPAFPGLGVDEEEASEISNAFSGALAGTLTVLLEPEDTQLDTEAIAEIAITLSMLVDDEPVTLAETSIANVGIDEPVEFAIDYEPSLIDPELTYLLAARALDEEGEVLAESDSVAVLTDGSPLSDVALQLTIVVPEEEAETTPEIEETPTPDESATPDADATEENDEATPTPVVALDDLGDDVVGVIVRFASPDSQTSGTEVRVELRNVTESSIVAETTADASDAGEPVLVRFPIAPGDVNPAQEYRVFVTVLRDGAPVGFTGRGTRVLTNGAPNAVEIQLP